VPDHPHEINQEAQGSGRHVTSVRWGVRLGAVTLALALCLACCDSVAPPGESTGTLGEPVQLVTDNPDKYTVNADGTLHVGCELMPTIDDLIADATHGTAYRDGTPAIWLPGYTGRRVGSEVEVLDRSKNVVATTGKRYQVFFVYVPGRGGETDDGTWPYVICDLYPCTPLCPIEHGPDSSNTPASQGHSTLRIGTVMLARLAVAST
jgi:hypothetical protein